MFNTIEIDRNNLTVMGVKFSDLKTLESTANASSNFNLHTRE
jgi:putative transcriptional regulator